MSEQNHRYKLFLEEVPEDSPDTLRAIRTALLSIGLSVEDARHALDNLPACIVDSSDVDYINTVKQQLKEAGAGISLELEEEEEFEIDLDFAAKFQKKGTQLYKLTEEGVSLEEVEEGIEEIDEGEIEALLQGLEQLQMVSATDPEVDLEKLATTPVKDTAEEEPEVQSTTGGESAVSDEAALTEDEDSPEISEEVLLETGEPEDVAPAEEQKVKPPLTDALEKATKNTAEVTEVCTSITPEESTDGASTCKSEETSPSGSKKETARKKSYISLILLSLLGSTVLLGGGIFAVKFLKPEEYSSHEEVLQQLNQASKKPDVQKTEPASAKENEEEEVQEVPAPDYATGIYSGALKEDKFSVAGTFTVSEGKLDQLELTITTVEPPALTDLEIVENKIRDPWIHTIRPGNISIDQNDAESFLVTSVARAYIDYNEQRYRLTADCVISGKIDLDTGSLKAKLFINRGFPQIPESSFLVQKSDSEKAEEFNFFLQTELSANYTGSKKSEDRE